MEPRNPIDPRFPLHQAIPFGKPAAESEMRDTPTRAMPRRTFCEQQVQPLYAFPGLATFIDSSFASGPFTDHSLCHRVKGVWFTNQAANALSNACFQQPEAARQSLDRAAEMGRALAMAASAIHAAIAEVHDRLGLDLPGQTESPEPPTEVTRGPRKLQRA